MLVAADYSQRERLVSDALRDLLLLKPHAANERSAPGSIPKLLHQTTQLNRSCIPDQLGAFATGYRRVVEDDDEARAFVAGAFTPPVLLAYDRLEGPHRADLYRYCKLFVEGGVYLDIKTVPRRHLDEIFGVGEDGRPVLYLVLYGNTVHNGVIASSPRNPLFLRLVASIVDSSPPRR